MKNYYDLYLKCDILSLADVFEKFGNSKAVNITISIQNLLTQNKNPNIYT